MHVEIGIFSRVLMAGFWTIGVSNTSCPCRSKTLVSVSSKH